MTLWPKASSAFVRRLLNGHKIMGLTLCSILYLICLSGWAGVYYVEVERWERPNIPEFSEITSQAMARATADTRAVMLADSHRGPLDTDLYIVPPTDANPRMIVGYGHEARGYNADGSFAGEATHDLTHFLEELHYYLHLPESFGMIVVCLFGVGMMGLLIGGALAHPKMFRDAFAFRLRNQGHLTRADLHNRIGAWTLPFGLIITITGTLIGLGQLVAMVMGFLYYNNDILKAYDPIFGNQAEITAATGNKPLKDGAMVRAIDNVKAAHPDQPITFIAIRLVGTPTEFIEITTKPEQRLVYGEAWRFDSEGNLKGSYHLSDGPAGRQVAASLYDLHFGSFGGWPVKLVYTLLGFLLTVMIAAGLDIWLIKSAEKGKPQPLIHRLWTVLIYGAPAMIALTFAIGMGLKAPPVPVFWGGLALMAVACIASYRIAVPIAQVSRTMRLLLGLSLLTMAGVHQVVHMSATVAAVQVNVVLVLLGLALTITAGLRWMKAQKAVLVVESDPAE